MPASSLSRARRRPSLPARTSAATRSTVASPKTPSTPTRRRSAGGKHSSAARSGSSEACGSPATITASTRSSPCKALNRTISSLTHGEAAAAGRADHDQPGGTLQRLDDPVAQVRISRRVLAIAEDRAQPPRRRSHRRRAAHQPARNDVVFQRAMEPPRPCTVHVTVAEKRPIAPVVHLAEGLTAVSAKLALSSPERPDGRWPPYLRPPVLHCADKPVRRRRFGSPRARAAPDIRRKALHVPADPAHRSADPPDCDFRPCAGGFGGPLRLIKPCAARARCCGARLRPGR